MPGYSKLADWTLVLFLAPILAGTGCSDRAGTARFEITGVQANWSNGVLTVLCQQRLTLSNEARDALVHGVPLTVGLDLVLRKTGSRTSLAKHSDRYEIRYLPLSERFQLTGSGSQSVRTYPRLRHVLARLADVRISFNTGELSAGRYQLLVRTRLEKQRLPPPMRLPVLFSANWAHDSSWTTWSVEVPPGA